MNAVTSFLRTNFHDFEASYTVTESVKFTLRTMEGTPDLACSLTVSEINLYIYRQRETGAAKQYGRAIYDCCYLFLTRSRTYGYQRGEDLVYIFSTQCLGSTFLAEQRRTNCDLGWCFEMP